MTTLNILLAIYAVSVLIALCGAIRDIRHEYIIRVSDVLLYLIGVFCPVVNTLCAGIVVMGVLKKVPAFFDIVVWRRGI